MHSPGTSPNTAHLRPQARCTHIAETAGTIAPPGYDGSQPHPNGHRERFAQAIVEGKQTKAAAIAAGYAEKSAGNYGRRLKKLPDVIARIEFLRAKALEKHEITAERVAKAYAELAFNGMSKYLRFTDDGEPYFDLAKCTPEELDLLSEVVVEKVGSGNSAVTRTKIKPHDRMQALDRIIEEPTSPGYRIDDATMLRLAG